VGKAPVRAGAELLAIANRPVGSVTSGSYGPSIGGPVAMGYVEAAWGESGTPLRAMVRGKAQPVNVADLPFVVPRYHRR
jgi:aminomethyltransferase